MVCTMYCRAFSCVNNNSLGRVWFRQLSSKLDRLDWEFLCNPNNKVAIEENIKRRKGVGNIETVVSLKQRLNSAKAEEKAEVESLLLKEALRIPNSSHQSLFSIGDSPKIVSTSGSVRKFNFKPFTFESLSQRCGWTRTDTSLFTGPRSYYLIDQLADLESALVNYTVDLLMGKGFRLVSVPDIVPREIVEDCGMDTRGQRSQVYSLGGDLAKDDLCLSGTAEIGISYLLKDKIYQPDELPHKLAAVSRCYRAETSKISEEKGIYRVHQFTKVEMYGVFPREESAEGLDEFRRIQEEIFSSLGLELRTLDMPECELGAQAHRKFDIEARFPGKATWGELSSASDCTDFQSRRLNIADCSGGYLHTVNGTACAVPRTIVAIVETHQQKDNSVLVPPCLVPYLGYDRISKSRFPAVVPFKIKKTPVAR